MFSFTTSGDDRLAGLKGFRFAEVAAEWAARVEPRVESAVKAKAPVGTGPGAGTLRDSIRVRMLPGVADVRIECTSSARYAGYVIKGTRPHVIRPTRAKALYWADGGGGHWARMVHHPGTRPNNFAARAIREITPHLAEQMAAITARRLGS